MQFAIWASSFMAVFLLGSSQVRAQVDVSSRILLRPPETEKPDSTGLESGRYKVRLKKKEKGPAPLVKIEGIVKPEEKKSDLDQSLFVPKETTIEPPPVSDQVKDLISGNPQPEVEAYKEQVHPDDIRLNRLEINVVPGVLANSSKSNYSIRDYSSFSPRVLLGADFWMTPFLGIDGSYSTSLGADISGQGSTNSRIPAKHEWSDVGMSVRRFFGLSRRSNSLQFGIYFSEYKFTVPSDDRNRIRTKSSGIGLRLLNRIPVAPSYSWIFGGKIIPRVQHSESGTGISASSGIPSESSQITLFLGGEFKLQRQDQIIWDLSVSSEKNQFSGSASLTDPATGSTPTGVSVENTFTSFSLGYRWGQ